jgi:ligand-binding sensor domain-containing protein
MQDKGICLLDIDQKQLVNTYVTTIWKCGQVNDVLDLGNEVWIATEENGLLVYDKKKHSIEKQLLNGSLTSSKINELQADNEANV